MLRSPSPALALALTLVAGAAGAETSLRVLGADGSPTPARVVVRGDDPQPPRGERLRIAPDGSSYFYTPGESIWNADVPPPPVSISKGFDHVPIDVRLAPGANEVRLERPFDATGLGYYGGDGHVHPVYLGTTREPTNAEILLAMKGENLNLLNALAGNALAGRVYWRDRVIGRDEPESEPDYVLRVSEEYRSRTFGHLAVFGALRPGRVLFSGFPGTPQPYDFPPNHDAALTYQRAGAFTSYAHLRVAPEMALEAPADIALGVVGAVEILGYAVPTREARLVWERLLRCGFDVVLTAGTDAVMGAPIEPVVGGARVYARLAGVGFDYARFTEALRAGRGFVTSGPLVLLRVEGRAPGEVVDLAAGSVRELDVEVEVLSVFPWRTLSVRHGGRKALAFASADGAPARQTFRGSVEVAGSSWINAEVVGAPPRHSLSPHKLGPILAITNPVWIRSAAPRRDAASARSFVDWIERDMALLEQRDNYGSPRRRQAVRQTLQRAVRVFEERAVP